MLLEGMVDLIPHSRWLDKLFDIRRPLVARNGAAVEVNFEPEFGGMFWGRAEGVAGTVYWETVSGAEIGGRTDLDLVPAFDPMPPIDRSASVH